MFHVPGFNHAQEQALDEQMAGNTRHKIGGQITDLSGNPTDGLDGQVAAYQVNIRSSSLVGRSCSVTLTDPNHDLNLIANDVYKQRMLKLWVDIYVIALDVIARIPFFTGPFGTVQRADQGVQATAQGKARLALKNLNDTRTIPANTRIDDIIHTILVRWCAFDAGTIHIPNIPERHAAKISTVRTSRPLRILRDVLQTIAYDDFFDGDGQWYTRQFPTTPIAEFTGGQDGTILGPIVRNETDQGFWNLVLAHGYHGLFAEAAADPDSALSAQSLKVTNNQGDVALGWVTHVSKNLNTKDQARLQQIADAELARGLNNAFTYQFPAKPHWRLEEFDPVTVNWRGANAVFNMGNWSLSDQDVMTVGYHRVASLAGPRARFQ